MKKMRIAAVASALMSLVGCASMPTGPTVLVLPGTNKNLDAFRSDEAQCRQYAAQQLGDQNSHSGVREAVVGTAVGVAAGAAIGGRQGAGVGAGAGLLVGSAVGANSANQYTFDSQRQYDNAYIQCVYAKGHRVPVSASFAQSLKQANEPATASIPPPPPYPPSSTPPADYVPPKR